jgi:hypothetical protein
VGSVPNYVCIRTSWICHLTETCLSKIEKVPRTPGDCWTADHPIALVSLTLDAVTGSRSPKHGVGLLHAGRIPLFHVTWITRVELQLIRILATALNNHFSDHPGYGSRSRHKEESSSRNTHGRNRCTRRCRSIGSTWALNRTSQRSRSSRDPRAVRVAPPYG